MRRRSFLCSLGALLIPFSVFTGLKIRRARKEERKESLSRAALDLFSDRNGMRRVGQRYLALHPQEADPERLRRRVEELLRGHSLQSREELRESVATVIEHEFSVGHIVLVDGWVLSLLEARLCALCAVS